MMKIDIFDEIFKPFFTGQYCECGGPIWSKGSFYACKSCNKETVISPTYKMEVNKK